MKLPLIKKTIQFIEEHDEDYVQETIDVLEYISDSPGLKDEDLNTIGELLSNFYGSLEVHKEILNGVPQKEALNKFMQRVLGSIDKG